MKDCNILLFGNWKLIMSVITVKRASPWMPGKYSWSIPEDPSTAQLFISVASPHCNTLSIRCVSPCFCLKAYTDTRYDAFTLLPKYYESLRCLCCSIFTLPFSFIRRRVAWWCSSRAAEGRTPSWTSSQAAKESRWACTTAGMSYQRVVLSILFLTGVLLLLNQSFIISSIHSSSLCRLSPLLWG